MENVEINELTNEDINNLLSECFSNFRSMQKTDFQVAFFHLLIQSNQYSGKSDFELSRLLKITETQVKNLRYKSSLAYPKDDYRELLKKLLKNLKYKTDGGRIQFSIKDKMLRLFTNSLLEEDGNFSDSSFNSDIVSVTPVDFVSIVEKLYPQDDERKKEIDDLLSSVRESLKKSSKNPLKQGKEKAKDIIVQLLSNAVAPELVRYIIGALII